MNDRACRFVNEVNNLSDCWRFRITRDHDGTGHDDRRVARLIEERPDETGVVLIIEISGDVNDDHDLLLSDLAVRACRHDSPGADPSRQAAGVVRLRRPKRSRR
ncbi:MAG: hypothetical protein ACRDRU_22525 [Pseudonocardiaceae bacterium]